jgi:serine protease Do
MMKKYLKLDIDYGVIITKIEINSSGYRSGLKIGDIILKVNGESVEKSSDIVKIIDEGLHRTGDVIILSIMRNNNIQDINLKLESENTNDSKIY